MSVHTPVMGSLPPLPVTGRALSDRAQEEIAPGMLYRHVNEPTIWRAVQDDDTVRMELVWAMPGYGMVHTFGQRPEEFPVGYQRVLTETTASSYYRCRPEWFGRVFMEFRDLIVREYSYEENP